MISPNRYAWTMVLLRKFRRSQMYFSYILCFLLWSLTRLIQICQSRGFTARGFAPRANCIMYICILCSYARTHYIPVCTGFIARDVSCSQNLDERVHNKVQKHERRLLYISYPHTRIHTLSLWESLVYVSRCRTPYIPSLMPTLLYGCGDVWSSEGFSPR